MLKSLFFNLFFFVILLSSAASGMEQPHQPLQELFSNGIEQQIETLFEFDKLTTLKDIIEKARDVEQLLCQRLREKTCLMNKFSFSVGSLRAGFISRVKNYYHSRSVLPSSLKNDRSLIIEFILKRKFDDWNARSVWLLRELRRDGYGAVRALLKDGLSEEEKGLALASALVNEEQDIDDINDMLEDLVDDSDTIQTLARFAMSNKHQEMVELFAVCFAQPLESLYDAALDCGNKVIIEDYIAEFGLEPHEAFRDTDRNGLSKVAGSGDIEIFRYVWNAFDEDQLNIDLEHKDARRMTVLMNACEKGHLEIVRYIIANSNKKSLYRQLEAKEDRGHQTPIMIASMRGHLDVIHALLVCYPTHEEKVVALSAVDSDGMTPLLNGIIAGQLDVVRFYVELFDNMENNRGLLISQLMTSDNYGRNAIRLAAATEWPDIFTYLLSVYKKNGLSVIQEQALTDSHSNNFFILALSSESVDIVKEFIAAYDAEARMMIANAAAALNRKVIDDQLKRYYHFVQKLPMVKDLLNTISPCVILMLTPDSVTGENALAFAARNGYMDIVKLLISVLKQSGVCVENIILAVNNEYKSALMLAEENRNQEIVDLFNTYLTE